MNDLPSISIVVPVLNRERTIGKCVQSLMELDYPSYEVIVVDNGSADKTYEIVSQFPVKLVTEERRGPYAARNKGIELAQGEMVFFFDSDCIATKDLLKMLVRNFTDECIAGVGGQLQTYDPATVIEQFEDFAEILVFNLPKGFIQWNKNEFLSGAIYASNVLFRKKVLEEVHGFDPDFMSGGDYHLCWTLQRLGYKLYFDPEAVVKHMHRADLNGLIQQFFKYGKEQPRLLKKQPNRFSYMKVKTYLFPPFEFRWRFPLRMLVSLDGCNLFLLSLIMATVSSLFLYVSLLVLLIILLGTFRDTIKVVRKSGRMRWFLLYPVLHLVRNYSFAIGRIFGGVRHRVIAF